MSFVCTFCGAPMPESPAGVLVRCASCDNVVSSPSVEHAPIPHTAAHLPSAPAPAPFGPSIKGQASPPPSVVLPSTAGGLDEIVGAGALLFGIASAKAVIGMILSALVLSCFFGILAFAMR